jgi:hypothetical protein
LPETRTTLDQRILCSLIFLMLELCAGESVSREILASHRKKKKAPIPPAQPGVDGVAAAQQPMPPPTAPYQEAPMAVSMEPPQLMNTAPAAGPPTAKAKKSGCRWKCVVNTHATKDCKVVHYCICDNAAHPTVRCPILNLPKLVGYLVGCGNDATLDLILLGSQTALVTIGGADGDGSGFWGDGTTFSC